MIALPRRRELLVEWLAPMPLVGVMALAGLLFGGVAWWFRPVAVAGVGLATIFGCMRAGFLRNRLFLKSPLLLIFCLLWCWFVAQLVPLPRSIVARFSPLSEQVYAQGLPPVPITADDNAQAAAQPVAESRIPINLNRSAGLRRLMYLSVGIATFWFIGTWTDRQSKLFLILGLVIVCGMLHSAVFGLQLLDGSTGILGLFQPDQRIVIGPGWVDAQTGPHWSKLEPVAIPNSDELWPVLRSEALGLSGLMPGGFVSFAALQAIALPAAVGCIFFLTQRRGSRFELMERLRDRGVTALWAILILSSFIASLMLGSTGSLLACIPAAAGILVVSVSSIRSDIEKWFVLLTTAILISGFVVGFTVVHKQFELNDEAFEWIWADSTTFNTFVNDARAIWQNSGWTGIGLGAYSSVSAYWKHSFVTPSNVPGSALELMIEAGLPALLLILPACLWTVWRLIRSIGKSEQEHRCLAGAVFGSSVGLIAGLILLTGWEIPLLILLGFSILGLTDRSLCGARDLYVEAWDSA